MCVFWCILVPFYWKYTVSCPCSGLFSHRFSYTEKCKHISEAVSDKTTRIFAICSVILTTTKTFCWNTAAKTTTRHVEHTVSN